MMEKTKTGFLHCGNTGMIFALTVLLFIFSVELPAQAENEFTLEHLAKIRFVDEVKISPDGRYIAYTLAVPRLPFAEEDGRRWVELHVVDTSGNSRPFVTGKVNVSAIAWTPDGKYISYLARRGDDKPNSLYIIPLDGGESRKVLEHATGIDSYSWGLDGRLAFLAAAKRGQKQEELREDGFVQEVYEEELSPVRVWLAEPFDTSAKPRALSLSGSASEMSFFPDGRNLALALAPTPSVDDEYMRRKVHVIDAVTGRTKIIFDNPGKLGRIVPSPDGRHVAVIAGVDINDPLEGHLMVGDMEHGGLTDLLPDLSGHVVDIAWRDEQTILYTADEGVYTTFNEIRGDGTGQKTIVSAGGPILGRFSLTRDGQNVAFDADSPTFPWEVYYLKAGEKQVVRLTDSNPWLAGLRLAPQEVVDFKARDSLDLQGILIRPLDEQPGERYPLILVVHGGPEDHERNGWKTSYSRLGQAAAARGFAVFFPNYRGSTGRGVEFSKMGQGDYAGREFDDLVDAVDHLVNRGLVRRDKVGIMGGSYGGYAAAWGATALSKYFAASVMAMGISDLLAKFGTTDIPNEMYHSHARRWPWENWQWYLQRSPIFYAQQAKTPLLILHGTDDTRVHPSQSIELYRYLKTVGKAPVRLVLYPGEGHGNSRACARYDFSLRAMRWMEHYLQGLGGDPPPYEMEYPLNSGENDSGNTPKN